MHLKSEHSIFFFVINFVNSLCAVDYLAIKINTLGLFFPVTKWVVLIN